MGVKKPLNYKRLPIKKVKKIADLPESYDLRTAFPNCKSVQMVRDQSACGSCWAFGAAEAMSDRICIQSKGQEQTLVSSENLVACCSDCGDGCNGGTPSVAWSFWQNTGIPSGGLYGDNSTCQPYKFPPCDHHVNGKYGPCPSDEYNTPTCSSSCVKASALNYNSDLSFASSAYGVDADEQSIMTELYTNGSIEVDFTVYADFPLYKSGVYQQTSDEELGGHAVKLIGWGVENGTKYWLIANSWNNGWGDHGYFKIIRGVDECGIEDDPNAGMPILKSSLQFLQ
jgi:cathepsin B